MSFEPPQMPNPTIKALRFLAWSLVALGVLLLVVLSTHRPVNTVLRPEPPRALPPQAMPAPANTPELVTAAPPMRPVTAEIAAEVTPVPSPELPPPPAPETPEAAPAPEAPMLETPTPAPPAPALPAPEVPVEAPPASVVDVPVLAPPESLVVEVRADGTIATSTEATPEELLREIKRLQEKFDQLQETVNLVVTQMMSDVEDENHELRSEVRRLQAREQAGLLGNSVPRPGGAVIAGLAAEAANNPEPDSPVEEAPLPTAEFSFNVMKEWGREPEAVAELGGNAPTLKGVIGVVPRGSAREDVEALGRELRDKYNGYDNINVEIFDDPVAAQSFVDSQDMDANHRVLSVSKYAATGRDAVTYYVDGNGTDLSVGNLLDNAQQDAPDAEAPPVEQPAPAKAPAPPAKSKGRRSAH